MITRIAVIFSCLFSVNAFAQFKNDNVLYTTVDPDDLCATLDKNKGYLLLDVRSKGEHHDTSSFPGYNLGRFKGAVNIDINELGKRLQEIKAYKDKPIFVYCSHSQRSRRAGKMLADSGFTKVFNINGGMTAFHYKGLKEGNCVSSLYETGNNYDIISFNQVCKKLEDGKAFVLDVRTDSAFRHISTDSKTNALGTITGAVNIPLADLAAKLREVPNDREIIVTDLYGGDAAKAAVILKNKGYEKVSVLIEGVDRVLSTAAYEIPCKARNYKSPVSYTTLNAIEFGSYIQRVPSCILLDVRTDEEFSNRHKDSWRNIGHLKNAINIPADVLETKLDGLDKNKDIIVYGTGSGPEVFRAVALLHKNGFTKARLLVGGIFNLRWSSGNIKGQEKLRDMVVDVPVANQ